jgi:flap endonuclease-1
MGVRFLMNMFPEAVIEKPVSSYKGTMNVVDGPHQLVKYALACRNKGFDVINNNGESVILLHSILRSLCYFASLSMIPEYIFDGKTPEEKKLCIKLRNDKRNEAEIKCAKLNNKKSTEYCKNYKRSFSIDRRQIIKVQELLGYLGIPSMEAPYEADPQCAANSHKKNITGVISDDSDICIFGAGTMLKDFGSKNKCVKELTQYNLLLSMNNRKNKLLLNVKQNFPELKIPQNIIDKVLERDNLIDIAILFGSEYSGPYHIKGISAEDIFLVYILCNYDMTQTVKKFMDISKKNLEILNILSIEQLIEHTLRKNNATYMPPEFADVWEKTKKYYLNAPIIHPNATGIEYKIPNRQKVIQLLCI